MNTDSNKQQGFEYITSLVVKDTMARSTETTEFKDLLKTQPAVCYAIIKHGVQFALWTCGLNIEVTVTDINGTDVTYTVVDGVDPGYSSDEDPKKAAFQATMRDIASSFFEAAKSNSETQTSTQ